MEVWGGQWVSKGFRGAQLREYRDWSTDFQSRQRGRQETGTGDPWDFEVGLDFIEAENPTLGTILAGGRREMLGLPAKSWGLPNSGALGYYWH
jgi:hypothetical protein